MVRRVTTETLQSALAVSTDKTVLLKLVADKQKRLVYSIQFSSEDTVKTVEAIGKYLAVLHESTAYRSLNKRPIIIHHCMVWICGEEVCEVLAVIESGCHTSCISGMLEFAGMVYDMPECNM